MNRLCMVACKRWRSLDPRGGGGGAGTPRVRPHCSWLRSPLPCSCGLWAEPGPLLWWYSVQVSCVGGLLFLFSLAHFCFTPSVCTFLYVFHLYLIMWPTKHDFSNTSGTRSIVKAYASKVCLFLLFWTIIGGRIWSLVTANKSPKLNLCSSRANS
jgi:hypothetical protein